MSVDDENFKAQCLPAQQELWEAAWVKQTPFKKELEVTRGEVLHYLDFGDHFDAVVFFCDTIKNKLCVFQEYLDAFYAFKSDSDDYENGACIIGQPGIGKSCFIAYAVFERLQRRGPVAVEVTHWDKYTERYLLFTADGVTLHRGSDTAALKRHPGIWALSDSDSRILIPTVAFTDTRGVRTFQAASPRKDRHQDWTKQKEILYYVMDIPSKKDIQHLSLVLDKDVADMQSAADQWGNIPRTLLAICGHPKAKDARENEIRKRVKKITEELSRILDAFNVFDTSYFNRPSAIFFFQPLCMEDGTINRQDHSIFIPTHWLQDQVVDALLRRKEAERTRLFEYLTGSATTRPSAGGLFESITHAFLCGGRELHVSWYKNLPGPEPASTVSLPVLTTWPANVDLKAAGAQFFYWRPRSSNFPAIDAAIFTPKCIYLIQATIAMTHRFLKKSATNFHNALPGDRKLLPKKFLVVGYTERQTEAVMQNLISELSRVGIKLDVGSITIHVGTSFTDMVNEGA